MRGRALTGGGVLTRMSMCARMRECRRVFVHACADLHLKAKARVLVGICGLCGVGASARAHAHMFAVVPCVCGARTAFHCIQVLGAACAVRE